VTGTLARQRRDGRTFCRRRVSANASDELGLSAQGVVRLIEWATGQPRIRRMYERYTQRGARRSCSGTMPSAELQLDLRLNRRPADAIPASGPLMVVANHPFRRRRRIILCWLVAQARLMQHRDGS